MQRDEARLIAERHLDAGFHLAFEHQPGFGGPTWEFVARDSLEKRTLMVKLGETADDPV